MKRKNSINKYNGKDTLHLILLVNTLRFKSFTSLNEVCFSSFSHNVSIEFNEFEWNKCNVVSRMIISKEMF